MSFSQDAFAKMPRRRAMPRDAATPCRHAARAASARYGYMLLMLMPR